jgi:hypothetical protein
MATIVTRAGKGSPLTHNEVDSNFTNLNTDKVELVGTSPVSISVNTASTPALTITQTGAGHALLIEDDTSPDSTPVVFSNEGSLVIGTTTAPAGQTLTVTKNLTGSTTAFSIRARGQIQSDVTTQAIVVGTFPSTAAATFTLPNLFHFFAGQNTIDAASTVTNQWGISVASNLTGATNNYGINSAIASGTNRWNLWISGTAPNYMAGPLGIGATTTGDPLRIAGTINHAAFSNAQIIDATIGSSVTSSFRGVMSRPITQDATFTLSNLIHFYVNPQAKGASSTITNQYGFFAESSITDATSNFGFYSNIAAASNRWNFYAAGTAQNYFAGNTFVGATTGDQALNVNGAVRVSAITTANQTSAGTMDFTGGNMRFLVWGSSGVQGAFSWWTGPGASGASQRMSLSGTTLTLGVSGSTTGALACTGSTSGTVTITPAAVAGTWTLTLPTSAGTNGYVLSTDGAGVTSWVAQSGGGGGGGSSVGSDIFLANSFGGF